MRFCRPTGAARSPGAASPSRCVAPALVACAGDGGAVLSRGPRARTFPLPGSDAPTSRPLDERPGSAGPPPPGASRPPPPEPAPAGWPASDARYDVPREVLPTAGACNTHSSRRGPSPATTYVGATADRRPRYFCPWITTCTGDSQNYPVVLGSGVTTAPVAGSSTRVRITSGVNCRGTRSSG